MGPPLLSVHDGTDAVASHNAEWLAPQALTSIESQPELAAFAGEIATDPTNGRYRGARGDVAIS
jgi:hypothetical protein